MILLSKSIAKNFYYKNVVNDFTIKYTANSLATKIHF